MRKFVFISSVMDVIKHSKMKEEQFETADYSQLDEFQALKQREKLRLLIEIEKEKLRNERALDAETHEKELGDNDGREK
jgi:hypothetical protein